MRIAPHPRNNSYIHESEEWSSQLIFQFKHLELPNASIRKLEEAWKNQGGAMLYQLSYEATLWERGQFNEFISPARSEIMPRIYEIIPIWTAVIDGSEE